MFAWFGSKSPSIETPCPNHSNTPDGEPPVTLATNCIGWVLGSRQISATGSIVRETVGQGMEAQSAVAMLLAQVLPLTAVTLMLTTSPGDKPLTVYEVAEFWVNACPEVTFTL
jgi:hypothetical protein